MIVSYVPTEDYKPVSLTITLETREELQRFHAVFNYVPVCELFRTREGGQYETETDPAHMIRTILLQKCGYVEDTDELSRLRQLAVKHS